MSYHLENYQFTTVCPNLCVRCSVTPPPPPLSPTASKTSDLGTMMLFYENGVVGGDVNIFLIQFRTIQRLYVRWTHSRVFRLQSL